MPTLNINNDLILFPSGSVSVGTTSSDSKLQVNSSSSNVFRMVRSNNNIGFEMASTSSGGYGLYDYQRNDYDIFFKAGNVLINTTTDAGYKLDVNGSARISNSLWINNTNGTAIVNAYSSGSIGTYLAKASSATANFTTTGVSYPRGLGFGAIIGQGNTTDIPVNNASWNGGYGGNIGFWSDVHYGVEGGTNSIGFNAVIKGSGDSNSYGFFSDLSGVTDGTRYGIYTKGEQKNYFSGNVGIGTTAPVVKTHIVGPTLTTTSETTYPLWLSDTGDTTKALILGFDLANDVGVIQAVDQAVAWKDVCIAPTAAAVGIGNVAPSQKLHVTGNVRVTGAYYDSSNSAGSSGQVLSSTGSGTAWVNQGEATATSLYDLLPAARTTYDWTVQLTAGTWADIFSSNTVLSNGTWMVQAYVNDFAVGGQQYFETYSGVMSWGSAGGTNNNGVDAESEIILHRSGHAAQAGNFYLRTVERAASTLLFQGMSNQTYSAASTINFKFVKIF